MPIEERFSLSSVPGFLQTQDNSPINEMLSTLLRDPTEFSSIYSEFEFGEDFWQTLLTSFFEDKRGITEQLIGTNCIVLTTLADLALQASPEDFSEFSVLLENLITHAPEEQLSQLMAFVTNLTTNIAFLEQVSSTLERDGLDPSYIQPLNAFMKACFRRMR